ncbi:hypothetical protein TRIP_B330347 [uncultured Desulfatiglans sp.]|nr:hypothetical protein TRIP_B330347 [uncultured Desulfatiglans sp.]
MYRALLSAVQRWAAFHQMFDGWTKGSGIVPSVFSPDQAEKEALVEALRASRGN